MESNKKGVSVKTVQHSGNCKKEIQGAEIHFRYANIPLSKPSLDALRYIFVYSHHLPVKRHYIQHASNFSV